MKLISTLNILFTFSHLSAVPSCTWRWTIASASSSLQSVSRAPMTQQPSLERWRPAANWTFPTPYKPCTVSRLHMSRLNFRHLSATVADVCFEIGKFHGGLDECHKTSGQHQSIFFIVKGRHAGKQNVKGQLSCDDILWQAA